MIRISRNHFLNNIIRDSRTLIQGGVIARLTEAEVDEITAGKRHYYDTSRSVDVRNCQDSINRKFLAHVELNNSAVGFREGYSYLNFLEPHRLGDNFLRLDIKSFFHSILEKDVRSTLERYFDDEKLDAKKEQTLVDALLLLVMYTVPPTAAAASLVGRVILPVGFSTSPAISNIVFRKVDIQIQKFCSARDVAYTRYADDMLFSSKGMSSFVHSEAFEKEIGILISQLSLRLNSKKTIKRKHTISLNGYVIQSKVVKKGLFDSTISEREIRVSNKKTDKIKKIIYMVDTRKMAHIDVMRKLYNFNMRSKVSRSSIPSHLLNKYASDQLFGKIAGYRSYLISLVKFGQKYECTTEKTLMKYVGLIEQLNGIIKAW